MSSKTDSRTSSEKTQASAKAFSRRLVLKGAAAAGAIASVGPWFVRPSRAASDEINVYAWSDYIWPDMIESFEKASGIKINLAVYGSNDEVLNKVRATSGKGFDVVFPSVTYGPAWYQSGDLLQAIDESKINVDGIIPALYDKSIDLGGTYRGKRMLIPFDWGTEAIAFDSSARQYKYGELSFGTLWDDDNKGRVTVRQKSALVGAGLFLDATGQVPSNQMLDTYKDEESMRKVYDQILAFLIERKDWVRQFWNNTQETLNAFYQNNAVIGQTWDGPSLRMMAETEGKIQYLMPKEGGLTWLDTMGIPSGAENVEGAYAFINYMLDPKIGAMFANQSGYNSAAVGAEKGLKDEARKNFTLAYPDDAIDKLWWWPPEPAWWVSTRAEYSDKYTAA